MVASVRKVGLCFGGLMTTSRRPPKRDLDVTLRIVLLAPPPCVDFGVQVGMGINYTTSIIDPGAEGTVYFTSITFQKAGFGAARRSNRSGYSACFHGKLLSQLRPSWRFQKVTRPIALE